LFCSGLQLFTIHPDNVRAPCPPGSLNHRL
jgi:hypothetical protein